MTVHYSEGFDDRPRSKENLESFAAAAGAALHDAIDWKGARLSFVVIVGDNNGGAIALAANLDRDTAAALVMSACEDIRASEDPGIEMGD